MRRNWVPFVSPFLILALLSAVARSEISPQRAKAHADPDYAAPRLHTSLVMFIQNAGQWDQDACFQVWGGPAGTVWLAEDAIWLTVIEPQAAVERRRLHRFTRLSHHCRRL